MVIGPDRGHRERFSDTTDQEAREWVTREFEFNDARVPKEDIENFLKKMDSEVQEKLEQYKDEEDEIEKYPRLTLNQYTNKEAGKRYSHTNNLHARFSWELVEMKKNLQKGKLPVIGRTLYYLYKKGLLQKLFEDVGYDTIKDLHDFGMHYNEIWDSVDKDFIKGGGVHKYGGLRATAAVEPEKLTPAQLKVLDESQDAIIQRENLARKVYIGLRKLGMPQGFMCG